VNVLAPGGMSIRACAGSARGLPINFKLDFPIKPGEFARRNALDDAVSKTPAVFADHILTKGTDAKSSRLSELRSLGPGVEKAAAGTDDEGYDFTT